MGWYEEYIEPGVRDIVRLLRNNGINTECSCEHQMYVQFQVIQGHDMVQAVDCLLFNEGYRDYIIEITVERMQGFLQTTGTVYFPKDGTYPVQNERISALEQISMLRNSKDL